MSARILTLDIETAPNMAYVWGLWNENIPLARLVAPVTLLSFAAKWLDEPETMFYRQTSTGKTGPMVRAAHRLLDQADVVITYNGKKFDIPHLQREILLAGLTPPSPFSQVDLYQVVRKQFKFPSNKLEHIVDALGIGAKFEHSGFDLWPRCMAGEQAAWTEMETYNTHDVVITEQVYQRLLPWITSHPHLGLWVDEPRPICSRCQSARLQRRGAQRAGLSVFQRYHCQDCGAWSRGGRRVNAVDVRGVS